MKKSVVLALAFLLAAACNKSSSTSGSSGSSPAASASGPVAPSGASVAPPGPGGGAVGGTLMGSCGIGGVACSDYYGSGSSDGLKKVCLMVGKWSDGACPTANIQGTCTKTEGGGILNKAHTYPPGTPVSAKTACDNTPGGAFSAK